VKRRETGDEGVRTRKRGFVIPESGFGKKGQQGKEKGSGEFPSILSFS
jgi:hypothetical protein